MKAQSGIINYLKGRLQMELNEYDYRLGANDPTDFPAKRFENNNSREVSEPKSSESTGKS